MKAIFIFVLLFCPVLYANSIELIGGGLTYHTFIDSETSDHFSNKLNSDGSLIYNQLYGFSYTQSDDFIYNSYKFFMGHNSIDEQIGGILYSSGFSLENFDVGPVLGFYYQDGSKFADKGISLMVGDLMPVFGLEINYKIMISDTKYIKINNIFTPLLISNSLSIGESF